MKKATLLIDPCPGFQGNVALFKLEPPYEPEDKYEEGAEYVVVSTIQMAFDTGGPETYIFPADVEGIVQSWGELKGSFRGGGYNLLEDRRKALNGLGYEADRYIK